MSFQKQLPTWVGLFVVLTLSIFVFGRIAALFHTDSIMDIRTLKPRFLGEGEIFIIDGDTIERGGVRYRFIGVDTPELEGACEQEIILAHKAKAFAAAWFYENRNPAIHVRSQDVYGRQLAVIISEEGEDIAHAILAAGLGKKYRSTKNPWCQN